ncbi:MAG TPA: ABC transporter permease, partial [Levilinea sp.]|nr:ABC transporter permease [Levilinea sp.]
MAKKQSPDVVEKKPVSQSYYALVWWKFKKNRLAIVGAVILILSYTMMVLLPEFVSPYLLETRSDFTEARPQTIRFVDSTGRFHLRPFVYGLERHIDQERRIRVFLEDPDRMYPIHFFVRGEPYRILGLIPWDVHLFGVKSDDPDAAIFIMGTDSNGRDYFTRIIYGGRLSLMLGLIG